VKKMTATMNTVPATTATQAANWKTLGVVCTTSAGGGGGAVAVEDRTVGVSDVSLMRRMMHGQTIVTAMHNLSASYELEAPS